MQSPPFQLWQLIDFQGIGFPRPVVAVGQSHGDDDYFVARRKPFDSGLSADRVGDGTIARGNFDVRRGQATETMGAYLHAQAGPDPQMDVLLVAVWIQVATL